MVNTIKRRLAGAAVGLAGILAGGVAAATPVTMTFDQLTSPRGEYVNEYYNGGCGIQLAGSRVGTCGGLDYGVVWSGAVAGAAPNGTTPPTTPNLMTYAANGSAFMNVAAGFEDSVWFYYATRANATGSIAIYDGLNGAGSLLASMTLPSTTSRQCPGGLQNVFGCWNLFEASFTGFAQSVVFAGSGLGFDNVSFNLRTPATAVPEPAALGVFGLGALLLGVFAGLHRRFH